MGFQLLLPEVGMKSPVVGSFNEVVDAFAKIVRQNPALAQKYGWPTTLKAQEDWIDTREAQRMLAHGWLNFLAEAPSAAPIDTSGVGPAMVMVTHLKKNAAVGVVKSAKAAAAAWASLFGGSGPVAPEVAERRAAVCVSCPRNNTSADIGKLLIKAGGDELLSLLRRFKKKDIATSRDGQLGVCEVCNCPMQAKVHVHIDVLKASAPPEIWPELPREPLCWLLQETNTP